MRFLSPRRLINLRKNKGKLSNCSINKLLKNKKQSDCSITSIIHPTLNNIHMTINYTKPYINTKLFFVLATDRACLIGCYALVMSNDILQENGRDYEV